MKQGDETTVDRRIEPTSEQSNQHTKRSKKNVTGLIKQKQTKAEWIGINNGYKKLVQAQNGELAPVKGQGNRANASEQVGK